MCFPIQPATGLLLQYSSDITLHSQAEYSQVGVKKFSSMLVSDLQVVLTSDPREHLWL